MDLSKRAGIWFKRRMPVLVVCFAGLAINLLGVRVALGLKLPLYLDCIGTMLASVLSGYIPGIAVGFLTNIINSLSDGTTAYYGALNVMIAILAAWAANRDGFRRPRIKLTIALMALMGGGLGSVLTWLLYGGSLGEGISAPLAHAFLNSGMAEFWAQLTADMAIDLLDKAVCVVTVALVIKIVPESLRKKLRFFGWRQAPLNSKERRIAAAGTRFSRHMSLRAKVMLLIAAATLLISVIITSISFIQFHESNIEQQVKLANGVVNVVASNIDPARVDEFLEKGEDAEGYNEIRARLGHIMNSTDDIEYVYVYRIMEDGCHVVFDPDSPDLKGEAPGTVIPFDETFMDYVPALIKGEPIDPVISNEKYGWLLTVYKPVYDESGLCQCYAAVDISMKELVAGERVFLVRVIALFLGFFILILAVGAWLADYNVVFPINAMAMVAGAFAYDSEAARTDTVEQIRRLDIRTGDEIENLYHAIEKTTEDTVRYITEAQEKNETISKLQNGLIMVMADLVESRDKCTGDHVRKTAAYAEIIMRQMQREGIYADRMSDAFISDVVNSAPLHDVGKIKVSDTLLNKPGRLTDDEFRQMQNHTTAGGEIIRQAIGAVSREDTGYLNEAVNLAAYHHEKWNGTGYPIGLAGEQIPLSARIMAVADVFDALVSRRSYKAGFPIEQAMDIIREGSGTHFDPSVVHAFLDAETEVRRVAEQHGSTEA